MKKNRQKKIFVIDDDEGILNGFQAVLESAGYEVKTSPNSRILTTLNKNNAPDLIILDVLLSGEDGRDLCKKLKNQKTTKHIPVIMISAAPNIDKSISEAHANDFLTKPFEIDNLLTKVQKHTKT